LYGLSYACQRRGHAVFLALRPGQGALVHMPFDWWPALHLFRPS
jgi:hypothetical protein